MLSQHVTHCLAEENAMFRRTLARVDLVAFLIAFTVVCSSEAEGQKKDNAQQRYSRITWDANLTEKTEKLILQEIDTLGKKARDKLSPADLKHAEAAIERQLKALRTWACDNKLRVANGKSVGPFFVEFLRHRESGKDIRRAPVMLKGAGIAGLKVEFSTKSTGKAVRHEGAFSWTAADGSFVKEWSKEKPVDEEYHARVTGNLRLSLLVDVPADGKVIRGEAKIDKNIFVRYPVVLKGSEAKITTPINVGGKKK